MSIKADENNEYQREWVGIGFGGVSLEKTEAFQKAMKERIFESGAKRDSNKGKIRPDLISPVFLRALGRVLADGAEHYGDRNWEKGMPQECFKESAARHFVEWMAGNTDEDHEAKLAFNVMAFIHFRDKK